jgi:hypothetical protein
MIFISRISKSQFADVSLCRPGAALGWTRRVDRDRDSESESDPMPHYDIMMMGDSARVTRDSGLPHCGRRVAAFTARCPGPGGA